MDKDIFCDTNILTIILVIKDICFNPILLNITIVSVSYTHLDVYKRQVYTFNRCTIYDYGEMILHK